MHSDKCISKTETMITKMSESINDKNDDNDDDDDDNKVIKLLKIAKSEAREMEILGEKATAAAATAYQRSLTTVKQPFRNTIPLQLALLVLSLGRQILSRPRLQSKWSRDRNDDLAERKRLPNRLFKDDSNVEATHSC